MILTGRLILMVLVAAVGGAFIGAWLMERRYARRGGDRWVRLIGRRDDQY